VGFRARVGVKVAVWGVCLTPLAALLYRFWTDDLTANPISYVTNELGQTALQLLLASLALTPLRLAFGIGWQMTLRRLLGLFAFFYVSLHLSVWLVLDHYCASGTQPRLVSRGLEGQEIQFAFESGTGLASPATGHIHAATFSFLPDGGFESRWTWKEPGNTHIGVRRHTARRAL